MFSFVLVIVLFGVPIQITNTLISFHRMNKNLEELRREIIVIEER